MSDDTLIDEELARRDANKPSWKDKFKSKKKSFDEYRERRALESEKRYKTRELQGKLDRSAALEKAREDRKKLKELKQIERAKKDAIKIKEIERRQKWEGSFLGKVSKGLNSMSPPPSRPVSRKKSSMSAKPKFRRETNPFGDSYFDMVGFGNSPKRKKGKNDMFDIFK